MNSRERTEPAPRTVPDDQLGYLHDGQWFPAEAAEQSLQEATQGSGPLDAELGALLVRAQRALGVAFIDQRTEDSATESLATAQAIEDYLARLVPQPCSNHDPNSGPGSDWCPNCGQYARPARPAPLRADIAYSLRLNKPARPADTALREALEGLAKAILFDVDTQSAPTVTGAVARRVRAWLHGIVEYRRDDAIKEARAALAAQPTTEQASGSDTSSEQDR